MAKKKENKPVETPTDNKIITEEPVVIDENAIITDKELKDDKVIDVETPDVIIEPVEILTDEDDVDDKKSVKLKIEESFTDKYDESISYVKGEVYPFSKERAKELLNDPRGLVSKA